MSDFTAPGPYREAGNNTDTANIAKALAIILCVFMAIYLATGTIFIMRFRKPLEVRDAENQAKMPRTARRPTVTTVACEHMEEIEMDNLTQFRVGSARSSPGCAGPSGK